LEDALALEDAGAFSIVLECVPAEVAKKVTDALAIPTIGIGAGPDCDGQVLVTPDLLGLFDRFTPKFVKRYANLAPLVEEAVKTYIDEVKTGKFPSEEHVYK
jgi:3-methyl-2-oxobutanoate hydroxymethyltransferase